MSMTPETCINKVYLTLDGIYIGEGYFSPENNEILSKYSHWDEKYTEYRFKLEDYIKDQIENRIQQLLFENKIVSKLKKLKNKNQ